MYNNKKILALIPARAGSKRLSGKNIKPLLGKPLIAWTIEHAKKCKYIDSVIVSTESREIAEISRKYGAQVPFLRPEGLATDQAKSIEVLLYAIEWFNSNGIYYDLILLLQPTSPLRLVEDIEGAIQLLFLKNAKAIVSICEAEHLPFWMNTLPADGSMKDFLKPEIIDKNRQEFSKFYRLNGAVFLGYCDYMKKQRSFFGEKTFAFVMPKERSVDIDDETDFMFTEFLAKKYKVSKNNNSCPVELKRRIS
ncbi:MAG: acylneuraminate cytidylyltransferase family protein [Candidatus Omnitrophota bacterium]